MHPLHTLAFEFAALYLVLLPETLPFLAELLEDSNPEVEELAQRTAKMLQELSGEDIAEYLR